MTGGWPVRSISDVCQVKPPKSEAREKVSDSSLVSFLPMEQLGIGQKNATAAETRPLADVAGSYTYFADGDVLLAKITPCFENGKLGIVQGLKNGIGFGSSEYIVLRPDATLSSEWLYYFLARDSFRADGASRMTGAVGHKRVPKEFVETCQIPMPSTAEQRRIVAILDKAFKSIASARVIAEKNLQNARELFERQRDEVFERSGNGYMERKLSEVCSINSQLVDPRKKEFADLVHVGAGNMQSKTGVLADLKTARDEKLISGKFQFKSSAVLYSKIRPYLRKAARPSFAGLCSADVYPLDPIDVRITRDYLYHLLLSSFFTKYAIEGSARAGMPKVNRDHLFAFKCALPRVEVQVKLVTKLDQLEKETQRLESIYHRKLAALDELKQSLLHEAFSGAL